MTEGGPGTQLLDLCSEPTSELLLVAPFIKVGVIYRILESIPSDTQLKVVTRWRLEEIAAGVSDIEVFDALADAGQAPPLLRHDLHAKFYRNGSRCLVGSANLTALALGWRAPGNYELLVEVTRDGALRAWESALLRSCAPASRELVQELVAALEQLDMIPEPREPPDNEEVRAFDDWWPETRHPDNLYPAYLGARDALTPGAFELAGRDLSVLELPPSLPRPLFERAVGIRLLAHPVVRNLDAWLGAAPRRFGEVSTWLEAHAHLGSERAEIGTAWQTMMRWMLYFWPGRYELRVRRHTEVLHRVTRDDRGGTHRLRM